MYYQEHNPPHIHVRYNEHVAVMDIHSFNMLAGNLPARVKGLVVEWMQLHQQELMAMWQSKRFHKVQPLV